MKLAALAIALAVSACGDARTTPGGLTVNVLPGAGFPGDAWVDRTWSAVHAVLGSLKADESIEITYSPDVEVCGDNRDCIRQEVWGCHFHGLIMVQRETEDRCVTDALAHEIVHWWELVTDRPIDHEAYQFTERRPLADATLIAACKD